MAQEFRTFTQRRTKEQTPLDKILNQGETEIFNVGAKTLVDQFGNDVVDSKGNKIWFPADFDPAAAVAFGKSLASRPPAERYQNFGHSVEGGGPWDLQRSYNGQRNVRFAEVFTPAASYVFGLIGAAADIPKIFLMTGGGAYNVMKNPRTAGSYFGNNPKNVPFIEQGFRDYFESPFAPTVPKDLFQGNPALAPPTDRFKSTFDQASNASPESAPAAPGGWLNSMLRNAWSAPLSRTAIRPIQYRPRSPVNRSDSLAACRTGPFRRQSSISETVAGSKIERHRRFRFSTNTFDT